MKALSIKGDWAVKILEGKKTIETRTWKTKYRGKILLCASKNPKSKISGKAFATAVIVNCEPMVKSDEKDAGCEYYPRANSWFLEDVTPIEPFDVKGQLGIFEVEVKLDHIEYGFKRELTKEERKEIYNDGKSILKEEKA